MDSVSVPVEVVKKEEKTVVKEIETEKKVEVNVEEKVEEINAENEDGTKA